MEIVKQIAREKEKKKKEKRRKNKALTDSSPSARAAPLSPWAR
jgi:hypothetical protein